MTTGKQSKPETNDGIRSSALLFGGRLFSIALKFALQIFIVRYLSKSDYGAFAYAIALVEIGANLATLGLDKTASRFVSVYDEQQDYNSFFGFFALSFAAILGTGIALVLTFVSLQNFILGSLIHDPLIMGLLMIMISLVPILAIDSWLMATFAALSNTWAIVIRRYVVWPALQLLSVLIVIALEANVAVLAWCYLLMGIGGTVIFSAAMYRYLRAQRQLDHFSWEAMRFNTHEVFFFSLPTMLSGVAFVLRTQMILIFLQGLDNSAAVAEFRAVSPIAAFNSLVYLSFAFLFVPLMSRMLMQGNSTGVNDLYLRAKAWISIITLPIFLITFVLAQPLVLLFFGERYASSGAILAILALGQYVHAIMEINVQALRVYGAIKYLMLVDGVGILTAALAYWLLIPTYGPIGGAYGFLVTVALVGLLSYRGLFVYTDIKFPYRSFSEILGLIIFATLISAGIYYALAPSLFTGFFAVAILCLAVLRISRHKLQVGETFPELLKIPVVKLVI